MTDASGSEPRILVWAVSREGLGLDRVLLEIRPGTVRLIDPNLRSRIIQQLPLVPATVLFLGILAFLFATSTDAGLFLASLLAITILFFAGLSPFGAHVWGFMLREPRGAYDVDVVDTNVTRLGNLLLHIRIHHTDPALAPQRGVVPAADFPEDRWLACRHRKRVLAVLGASAGSPPAH